MPRVQKGKKTHDEVELTDVDSDSDIDLQPVRLPHGLPLDDPPPQLPISSQLEIEQVCQRHLDNGYIPMSVFPSLKVTVRAPARLRTYTSRSPSYGLPRRRLLPGWVSWDSEQHQEVPVHIGSACLYGSGMHALQLLRRLPTAQREHGHPRGQVQPTRLHQRAREALVLPSRGTWLQEEHGPDLSPKGQHQGRNHPLRLPGLEFDPLTKHATCPWKDDRLVLSAYTPLRANRLEIDHLVSLGFNL